MQSCHCDQATEEGRSISQTTAATTHKRATNDTQTNRNQSVMIITTFVLLRRSNRKMHSDFAGKACGANRQRERESPLNYNTKNASPLWLNFCFCFGAYTTFISVLLSKYSKLQWIYVVQNKQTNKQNKYLIYCSMYYWRRLFVVTQKSSARTLSIKRASHPNRSVPGHHIK